MLSPEQPDRIQVAFDDHRLVANAGLLLPVTLAHHLGLGELVDRHVGLGDAPGRANPGDKMLTLVASALAGGDCIDDADVLRTGGTADAIGCVVKAPSTLGTFLRSFRWGHVRQLDRVSRELLSRAWDAGAGPGDAPLTIDVDSTICETYGLCKEGARHHGYTGQRGYHPLLAVAAGTGDVLMCRLRQGRANTARGAAHFLREAVGRVRYAGAKGPLTVRADSGFYTHAIIAVCRKMKVRFSITVRQHARLRNLIDAIPEGDWTPIRYWMEGAADVAETAYTPFKSEPDAVPVRLIVRRVKPTPGSQLAPLRQLQLSRLHHRPGGRHPGTRGRPPPPRRDRERHPRPEVRRGPQPSPLGALHPPPSPGLALAKPVQQCSGETAGPGHYLPDRPTASAVRHTTEPPGKPADPGRASSVSCCQPPADLVLRRRCRLSTSPWYACHTVCPAGLERIKATPSLSSDPQPLADPYHYILSVDLG